MQHLAPTNATAAAAATKPAVAKAPSRMMSAPIVRGMRKRPPRVFVYGPEKIGKSSFAAGAPNPVFLGKDDGTDELDINRLPTPTTYLEILEGLRRVERDYVAEGWQTLVLDPLNWFEPLIQLDVCGNDPKVEFDPFKQATPANARWRRILAAAERLWNRGLGVVILAHSKVKRVELPDLAPYDRYVPAMSESAAGFFAQWADAIMLASVDVRLAKADKHEKTKAYSDGIRFLHTDMDPARQAGNRLSLPPRILLSWDAFESARDRAAREARLTAEIRRLVAVLADEEIAAKVEGYLADPNTPREELANKLRAKVAEREPVAAQKPEGATATEAAEAPTEPTNDDETNPETGDEQS